MADRPLSPATDRRLGGPLPHQLPNRTRIHLCAINLWYKNHAILIRYAVLAAVSSCYPPHTGRLFTRYSPVRHCSMTEVTSPFALYVLCTPPAFILSQDQTLECWYSKNRSSSNQYPSYDLALYLLKSEPQNLTILCERNLTISFVFVLKELSRFQRNFFLLVSYNFNCCSIFKDHLLLVPITLNALSLTAYILYHIFAVLSRGFSKLFEIFFRKFEVSVS